MSDDFFASTNGVDNTRLHAEAKLECKICWYVYDPAKGDHVWQIPTNTPFAELPDYWRCPECDASKNDFLLLEA